MTETIWRGPDRCHDVRDIRPVLGGGGLWVRKRQDLSSSLFYLTGAPGGRAETGRVWLSWPSLKAFGVWATESSLGRQVSPRSLLASVGLTPCQGEGTPATLNWRTAVTVMDEGGVRARLLLLSEAAFIRPSRTIPITALSLTSCSAAEVIVTLAL